MPGAGFEHTIPEFERSKTVRALDGAATDTANTIIVSTEIPRAIGQ